MVYFSNTAVCDRLRTEARGEDGLQPAKKDFIFGVAEGASGELHMAPLTSEESVVRQKVWSDYDKRPQSPKGRRKARLFTESYGRFRRARRGLDSGDHDDEVFASPVHKNCSCLL